MIGPKIIPAHIFMSDHVFLLYFIVKYFSTPLLLTIEAVSVLCSVVFRSFRVMLWSGVALTFMANAWIALFLLLKI